MAIARVQKIADTRASGVDSDSVTLTGVVAGALLVLTSSVFNANGTQTVTVTGGGTWTQAVTATGDADSEVYIHYTANATGGSTTVTCNPNGASADIDLTLSEYSGHDATPLDLTNTNTGTTTTPNVATGTLTQADELIVAIMSHTGTTTTLTPDGTYTQIGENENNSTGQCYNAQDKIVATTTSDTADWTMAANDGTWFCCVATFKASTGEVITLDKWFQRASEPTRRPKSVRASGTIGIKD